MTHSELHMISSEGNAELFPTNGSATLKFLQKGPFYIEPTCGPKRVRTPTRPLACHRVLVDGRLRMLDGLRAKLTCWKLQRPNFSWETAPTHQLYSAGTTSMYVEDCSPVC